LGAVWARISTKDQLSPDGPTGNANLGYLRVDGSFETG